ncbi:hypothetical protein IL306_012092 [Fusarium sp. DS 682]|nr:hypothetical protein IL306_012092 [Fusarium sp. DS 682]
MPAFQDYRIQKPPPRSRGPIRDRRFHQSLNINASVDTNTNIDKFKGNIFAHLHFSPTDPKRTPKEHEDTWLHLEKKDSASFIMASLHSAADDWECKNCSWQLRNLAAKFHSQFHSTKTNKGAPTSHPLPLNPPEVGSLRSRRDSDAMSTNSATSAKTSVTSLGGDVAYLKRFTLTKDIGRYGNSFYGVHQAHLDLSLGETVSVHMRPTDQRRKLQELQPGTIISAPFHSQNRDDKVSTTNYHTAVSGFGPIYSKYRKMVVIETWADHAVCLPIYSYHGKGLENRRGMADEYMDIRDADDEEPEEGDTDHKPLMAIRSEWWHGWLSKAEFRRMYKVYLGLLQSKALDVFGKPVETTIIPK